MQLDLKTVPFGRRLSRHMIYEEADKLGAGWTTGLYLALASESGGSFIGGPTAGPKGFIRITPTFGSQTLDYSYTASPFQVELKTAKGNIRFAMDGAKVLRITGKGIGLRLDGKLGFGGNAVHTGRGVALTLGGTVYLITALKGKPALDCRWELKALKTSDPVVTIAPDDDGEIDIAVYDTDDANELPVLAESVDESAAASEADYLAFAAGLADTGSRNSAFFGYASYALWMGFLPFKGKESACANKLSDQKIYALEQSVLTLPLNNAEKCLDIIGGMLDFASPQGLVPVWVTERQSLYEAAPPLYAYAVSRLIENGSLESVPRDKLSAFYGSMSKAVSWWLKKRTSDKGLCFYAYRHECGWQREHIFACEVPAATPDLAAYISLAAESLAKIAELLGKSGDAASWSAVSGKQLDVLTQQLWDGARFKCINAITGASGAAEGLLSLIPLILGKRLPGQIGAALAEKAKAIDWREAAIIPAALLILGLKDSGRDAQAKASAEILLESCIGGGANDGRGKAISSGAFYSPAACAALLALSSRTLQ